MVDGPFAETKELLAGYWIIEVGSLAEAVEWFRRCPNTLGEGFPVAVALALDAYRSRGHGLAQ